MRKYAQHVYDWVAEQQGQHVCACGCGQVILIKPKHYYGGPPTFVTGHQGTGRGVVSKWIQSQQGKHVCACGCGGAIPITRQHHSQGIPKYLAGHAMVGKLGVDHPAYRGGRIVTPEGYVRVLVPGSRRYEAEHRLVMEGVLGRKLTATETVHHLYGNKQDNRPEALELWPTNHPRGQRVSDHLIYAVEILRDYAASPAVWPQELAEFRTAILPVLDAHAPPATLTREDTGAVAA